MAAEILRIRDYIIGEAVRYHPTIEIDAPPTVDDAGWLCFVGVLCIIIGVYRAVFVVTQQTHVLLAECSQT